MGDVTCSLPDCEGSTFARGWCENHYGRWRRHGDPLAGRWPRTTPIGRCAVEDCPNLERQRGWCSKHYERWRRHGDPTHSQWNATPEDRFWPKVDASGDCWIWTAGGNGLGYGQILVNRKHVMAHRFSWEALVGPIPAGLELDHLCRNPPCVNPDHLEPVTHAENMRRAPRDAIKVKRAQTHCKHGHPLSGQNIRTDRGGHRVCRTCERVNGAAKRQRLREARHDGVLLAVDSLGAGVRRPRDGRPDPQGPPR